MIFWFRWQRSQEMTVTFSLIQQTAHLDEPTGIRQEP